MSTLRTNPFLDNGKIRLRFLRTARDTNGALLEMEAIYRPGSPRPPAHSHPKQEETFFVSAGALRFVVDGRERVIPAGHRIVIPAGTVHSVSNTGSEEARVIWQVRPALRTQELFEALYELPGPPSLLQMAVLATEHRDEMALASIPRVIQRFVFGLLAPFGRALAYRNFRFKKSTVAA